MAQFTIAWDVYDMIGSMVGVPVGQLAVGPIAAAAGTGPTLVGCATLVVLVTIAALTSRQVRELRRRTPSEVGEPAP